MRAFWVLVSGFRLALLAAQTPAYIHYTVQDGLPSNLVYCGLQDRRGLLWFGTDKGLACFDGTRFRTYGVSDGLPDPEVLNIQEDSRGRIWLSCFRKKPCYLLDGRIFTEKEEPFLEKIYMRTGSYVVSEEPGRGIWFTEESPKAYFVQANTVTPFDFSAPVAGLFNVTGAQLIMGQEAVMRFTADGELKTVHTIHGNMHTHSSVATSGNRILYGCKNELLLLEWNNGYIRETDRVSEFVGQAFADHQGRFWSCSPATGAVLFDNFKRDLSNPVAYLAGKKVNKVFEDRDYNMWFCTVNEGIYMLQQNAPLTYRFETGFPSINIRSLAYHPGGRLFIGDDVGSVHMLSGQSLQTMSIGASDGYNLVRQMIPAGEEGFWAASDDGLYYGNFRSRRITEFPRKLSLKSIWLQEGKVWIASATTFESLDTATHKSQVLAPSRFTTVCADGEKNLWIGGIDGLYSQRDSFARNWGDQFPELKNRIIALHPRKGNQLWVVTPKDELLLVDVAAGKVLRVQVVNRLLRNPVKNILSLYAEPGGRLWLATNRGIYGIDDNWHVLHFDTHDGLADDDVNAVLVHRDTLWAATVSGLTRMLLRRPEGKGDFRTYLVNLRYQKSAESVELHLLDSIFPMQHEIVLPPDASMLELDLAGLDYRSRGNLRYELVQTKLLLPVRWWTLDNMLAVLFSGFGHNGDTTVIESGLFNLGVQAPPGRYRIQATAIKASGTRSLFPAAGRFMILPYWYQTIWFYLFAWGIAGAGIWRIYRARLEYREMNAAAAMLQLQALQAQMNPHFIGNTVNAIQQFLHPPDPEKTSEYIAIFMRLLRRTMHFSEETFITVKEELAYDQEYLQLVQLRFENKFRYEISGADAIPGDTLIPSMLLQPLLENATIHGIAPEGISVLRLAFSFQGEQLQCTLSDNGIGIQASRNQKPLFSRERESKGIELLHKKINTLNRIYNLDLILDFQDLSESDARASGTRVVITYFPAKIWKAIPKLQAPTPA